MPRRTMHLLRLLLTVIIVLLFYGFSTYITQLNLSEELHKGKEFFRTDLLNRETLLDPPTNQLLDIHNFQLLISPSTELCRKGNILFFIVVHSKPNNFEQRRIIRSSWGKLKKIDQVNGSNGLNWRIKIIFVLGEATHRSHIFRKNIEKLVHEESNLHSDIVQGSFPDKYRNLVYKHTLSINVAYRYCPGAKFILKADDDAFVDLYGLYLFLDRTLGPLAENYLGGILAGNVFPASTVPQRTGKWAVSRDEYPWDNYPSYLGGLAYVMTPDVARDFGRAVYTMRGKPLWIDDVFITGVVANALNIHPLHLNARYVYDHEEVSQWYRTSSQRSPPPFTFAHLNASHDNYEYLMQNLWKRVSNIYKNKRLI